MASFPANTPNRQPGLPARFEVAQFGSERVENKGNPADFLALSPRPRHAGEGQGEGASASRRPQFYADFREETVIEVSKRKQHP